MPVNIVNETTTPLLGNISESWKDFFLDVEIDIQFHPGIVFISFLNQI